MGFDKFGIKSFVSDSKAEKFVSYLEKGKVMTTRCKKCQKIVFPPKMDCTICGVSEAEWIEIREIGRLSTFTTVFYGPAGFENETPYTLAVVQFPLGINILGLIDKKIPIDEIREGMELRIAPVRLEHDRFSYQFEKA